MSLLEKDQLLGLNATEGPCVSIYLPTHRAGAETAQDPIRLKNLLSSVAGQLQSFGMEEHDVEELLAPASRLVQDYDFWQKQSDGLVLLLARGVYWRRRLPVDFEEVALVGKSFHLTPLLPLLSRGGRFYILALSQGIIRLFEASPERVLELDFGETLPRNLADALGYDWEQKSLQYHSRSRVASGSEATYHGHGGGGDDHETELRRFLEILDNGLEEAFSGSSIPMVLAGVEEITSLFLKISHYRALVPEPVAGNHDDTSLGELHRLALEVVEPVFQREIQEASEQLREQVGTKAASADLNEIVTAVHDGRVATLFLARGEQKWGRYDPAQRTLTELEEPPIEADLGDEQAVELLNMSALRALETGATVYVIAPDDFPVDANAAAIFRY